MKKILLSLTALLMAGTAVAQVNFTFNRTSKTEADVIVSKDGETTTITATVAISGANEYKVQANDANNGTEGDLNSLPSVLCIARNTNKATEADPNKYTLTIKNNSENPIQFSKVILKNGGFSNSANWQGVNVLNSIRKFKIGYNGEDADAVEKYVCNNSSVQADYTGLYRYNSFTAPTPQIVNVGETYTLTVSVYTEPDASGMYYGLAEVSLVEPYSLEVGEAEYATLMLGYNAQIPDGVTCYKANVDGNRAVLTEIADNVAGRIDANTPVLVKADESGPYVFEPSEDGSRSINPLNESDTNEGNELIGTLSTKSITPESGTTCYVLAKPEGQEVAFYRATLTDGSFQNNANKAYLPVTAGAGARFLSFDFGTETAIDELKAENGNQKTETFDLAGRRVQNAQRGIFIVNGKKVVK